MAAPPPLGRLTFGVEFEFAIAVHDQPPKEDFWDNFDGQHAANQINAIVHREHQKLAGVLNGLPMLTAQYDQTAGGRPRQYNVWQVSKDGSIDFEAEEAQRGHMFAPVELVSPVFEADSADAFMQIHAALDAIRAHFDAHVNNSCGLHVHVGHSHDNVGLINNHGYNRGGGAADPAAAEALPIIQGAPWHVSTIQHLCAFLTAFERPLNTLHPPERQLNYFALAPSMTQLLPLHRPPRQLRLLSQARTIRRLYLLFNNGTGRFYAGNLKNLSDHADMPTTTTAEDFTNGAGGGSGIVVPAPPPPPPPPLPAPNDRSDAADAQRRVFAASFGDNVPPALQQLLPLPGAPGYRRPLHTIEFRQHTATLEPAPVVAWARILCGIVRFAHEWATTAAAATAPALPPFPSTYPIDFGVGATAPMLEHVLRNVPLDRAPTAHDILGSGGMGLPASLLMTHGPTYPDVLTPASNVLPSIMCALPHVSARLRAAAAAQATFAHIQNLTAPAPPAAPHAAAGPLWATRMMTYYTGERPIPRQPQQTDPENV